MDNLSLTSLGYSQTPTKRTSMELQKMSVMKKVRNLEKNIFVQLTGVFKRGFEICL